MRKRKYLVLGIIGYTIAILILLFYLMMEFRVQMTEMARLGLMCVMVSFMYVGGFCLSKYYENNKPMKINLYVYFVLYLVLLITLTLFDSLWLRNGFNFQGFTNLEERVNLMPFETIMTFIQKFDSMYSTSQVMLNLFGNVCAFMPMAFFLPLLFKKQNKFRYFVITMVLMILGIEFLQLVTGSGRFDVDDLMINTVGGVVGYLLAGPLTKLLPSRADIDQASYRRSQKVSLLRRLVALFCDLIAMMIIAGLVGIGMNLLGVHTPDLGVLASTGLILIGYFGVLPSLMNSQTIGHKLTRLQVVRVRGGPARWYQHVGRIICVGLVFIVIPVGLVCGVLYMLQIGYVSGEGAVVLCLAAAVAYVFIILLELVRAAIRRPLFYERWTDTRLISTTSIRPLVKQQTVGLTEPTDEAGEVSKKSAD